MSFSTGIKTALDASVYIAAFGSFALSTMPTNFLALDGLLKPKNPQEYNVLRKYLDEN